MKAAVIMGSKSDSPIVEKTVSILQEFGVDVEVRIISAHRTPMLLGKFLESIDEKGIEVVIAAAGKAAHLAGVLASGTTVPVIGLPIKSGTMDGIDSLLSTVQMPTGIPVATVAIDGAENAGLLAVQILSLKYEILRDKMKKYRDRMREELERQDKEFQSL